MAALRLDSRPTRSTGCHYCDIDSRILVLDLKEHPILLSIGGVRFRQLLVSLR